MFLLCQSNIDYWLAWEKGIGPGQTKIRGVSGIPKPGQILSNMLGCGAKFEHIQELNTWTRQQCIDNTSQIVTWLLDCPNIKEQITLPNAERLVKILIDKIPLDTA